MATPYPSNLPTFLRASKSRSQPAAFSMAEPRRGFAYAQATGTDTPVFWALTFRFTQPQAVLFQLWFRNTLQRGLLEFDIPIRTEFGNVVHTCRFLPDGLLNTTEDGPHFTYTAQIMARAQVIPDEYDDALDLIEALPDWGIWAGVLDEVVTREIPR